MYLWFTKILFPAVALIQEQTLLMNKKIIETNPELDAFHAFKG